MKRLIYSLAFVVAIAAAGTPAFAQQSGNLRVEFQGPGGHSSGAYGRVSALHAAVRAVILIQKALPAGSYQIMNLTGTDGNPNARVALTCERLRKHGSKCDRATKPIP